MDYFNQKSERLIYRKLSENDIESWIEFFESNDRLHFLGVDSDKDYHKLASEWIFKQLDRYQTQGLGHLAVIEKTTGKFIGMGGILLREFDNEIHYEISYSLKPTYWNLGYGTEIASQMKKFGKLNKISKTFISIIDKRNIQSINVARKNGMTLLNETIFLGLDVYIFGDSKEEN